MKNGGKKNRGPAMLRGLLVPCLMLGCFLSPVRAAIQKVADHPKDATTPGEELSPKPVRISTVELAANPERFVGKPVVVRAKVDKCLSPHWFTINEGALIPGPSLLVLVTKPAHAVTVGEEVVVAGFVRKFSTEQVQKEYGRFATEAQIEAEFKARPFIVANSMLTQTGEEIVVPPEPEEKLTPEQKQARDVHRVRATVGRGNPVNAVWTTQGEKADEPSPGPEAKITADARVMLDEMREAYKKLDSAEMNGKIAAQVEIGGQKQKIQHQFTSSFQAPNKFRHELEDGLLLIGSTGLKTYVFQKSANVFFEQDASEGKVELGDLPSPIPQLLQTQNPSLLFAIISDPVGGVSQHMKDIVRSETTAIAGQDYPGLVLTPRDGQSKITMLIDPKTHLLKRLDIEITDEMLKGGKTESGLQHVLAQVEYTTIRPQATFEQEHFSWTPPAGAKNLGVEKERSSAENLIGKTAPDFTLASMDGESISLSDLRGQVVVLDFWATWCPPCVRSLPHLDNLQQEKGDDGIKVLAINLKETEQQIHSFLKSRSLSLTVLMDNDGEVAARYNINAIPQTVIIGKDGEVKKVFVGTSRDTFDRIRAEIEAAKGGLQANRN